MSRFSKYHGCGNSFVIMTEENAVVLCERAGLGLSNDADDDLKMKAYSEAALAACDENTGVGADGFIVVREKPALEMVFFNRDGSRAPMCGNGIRCFANFCYDEGICREKVFPVKTLAGEMIVERVSEEPFEVRIDMGMPVFSPQAFGVTDEEAVRKGDFLGRKIALEGGESTEVDSMFMGTVHTVIFTDDLDEERIEPLGKEICFHPVFTEKTNVNFVRVESSDRLVMRTYERGVGMTLACGTGACASVVAASKRGLCGKKADVMLPLGRLRIEIEDDGHVFMQGPSVKITEGKFFDIKVGQEGEKS